MKFLQFVMKTGLHVTSEDDVTGVHQRSCATIPGFRPQEVGFLPGDHIESNIFHQADPVF